jgi:hypothetical protein
MLAEETGQTLDAVRDQLRRLLASGWIRVDGDGWALAWMVPFEVQPATQTPKPATRAQGQTKDPGDSNRRPPATLTQGEATLTAGAGDSNRRPSKQENSNEPIEHTSAGQPALPGFVAEQAQAQPAQTRKPKGSKSPTDGELVTWWSEIYLPLRARTFERWRPEAPILDLQCTPVRQKDIRARLNSSLPGRPWAEQRECLTHVVSCAAATVDEQKGAMVPWERGANGQYDTMKNIGPDYWLKPSRFQELLEAPRPAREAEAQLSVIPRIQRIEAPNYEPMPRRQRTS